MGAMPVDRWVSCFNVVLAFSWLPLCRTTPIAIWFLLGHLLLAGLLWCVPGWRQYRLPSLMHLGELYPLALIGGVWNELGIRHRYIADLPNDLLISRIELALFGQHPHELWVRLLPAPWIMEAMNGVYFTYYVLLVGVPLLVLLGNSRTGIQRMVLRLAVGYLGCFLIYLLFPVEGPRDAFPASIATLTPGSFTAINAAIRTAGDSLGTAFPSSHVVGAISLAWAAWECGPRWLRLPSMLMAAAIPAATVYTQNHYALDALSGVIVALILHSLVLPAVTAVVRPPLEA